MPRVNPDAAGRWGILGGTFDPIHHGHISLARACCRLKHFEKVLLVPAFQPPHKPGGSDASFGDRAHMVTLAVEDYQELEVDLLESEMDSPGYTLRVVQELKRRYPSVRFSFIVGADNAPAMVNWYRPERIFDEVSVLVGVRPGYTHQNELFPESFRFETCECAPVDVSSTEIRQRIKGGITQQALEALVPPAVADYILENGLYRT